VGIFGKSRFLEPDLEDWLLETWAWLDRGLDGGGDRRQTQLITPSSAHFPPTEAEGRRRALYVFDLVKSHMGLTNWPCELEAYDRSGAGAQVGEFWVLQSRGSPNGTFRIEQGRAIISYANDLVARPSDLIATLAHELSHYLLVRIEEPTPGGREALELATDLTVAYTGFGVFGANHAFSFGQHGDTFSQGWRSRRNGYFSERSWAFALALFGVLTDQNIPERWLKPSVADLTK
jgi:hypothetical protein